ncbi:MAG: LysM peptidoglycan-binding domain-containing protein [Mesorhizobium sp.]|nr:MAG: LysM peptidoglycan-binding domain-containing protein [Mesorhizobium sp.]
MSVRRISRPPIIAPERALRSEASTFRDQLQLATKTAAKPQLATVSADGGGRDLGLSSLHPGGNSAMRQSWSYAPVHREVAETQDRSADVDQGPVDQDGWGRAISDAQQRQAQQAEAATTAASIAEELEAGKSLELVAEERGLTRDEVVAELEAAGYEVETTGNARNGSDPRVTTIEDPQRDRTVTETERYDGSYEITVAADGETSTVVIVDGKETELAADQVITAEGCSSILEDVVGGKSLDEIAEERGLTREQVIAQLEAAGYKVETADPSSGNGDVERTEIIDAETDAVVAGHYSDHQHGAETIRYVDDEGNAVSRTEYGDGRVSETVTDKDGRQTTTVTEPVNGGETVEHEVQEGDNLTAIAEQYGITLEELEESNPELFDDEHNGGDLIHSGETVVIAGGTETTVTETANGYTLTTAPDGSMTLTYADGTVIEIAPGSLDETLARTLLAVDPDSSDPVTAAEGEIVTYVIEGLLAGQTYEDLLAELKMPAEEITAALADGLAVPAETATETDGQSNQIITFQGEPPAGQAPSGGDWVPVNVDGVWYWTDPEVAETIAAANVTLGKLVELQAEFEATNAQLEVWALDPDYEEAMEAAEATLDEALDPHGYDWPQPEPEGSLEDARNWLSEANALLEQASGAREAYEESERLLGEAIAGQETMPFYPEGPKPDEMITDGDYSYEVEVEKGEAAAAEIQSLFCQADEQRTLGDKLLTDYMLGELESQFGDGGNGLPEGVEPVEITIGDQTIQVAPEVAEAYGQTGLGALGEGGQPVGIQIDNDGDGTLEWQWVEADLATRWLDLAAQQDALGNQLELAEAYADYYEAGSDLAELEVQAEDIRQQLLAEYNAENPGLFEEDGYHNRTNGDYLGLFEGQELFERDGQIWVLNHFEHGDTEEALTYALDDPTQSEAFRERRDTPLNRAWQDVLNGSDGSDGLIALKNQELEAGETVNRVLDDQFGAAVEKLDELLGELQAEYDALLAEHGAGSLAAPEEAWLPEDVRPVAIQIAGQTVFVTPEDAEAYAEGGLEALTESGLQVKIEIDTDGDGIKEWRWADPELAESWIALSEAQSLREATEETRGIVEGAANWYAHQRTLPPKLFDDAETAAYNGRLETTYLEADEERALDERFQPWFQALYEKGYDGTARPVSDDDIVAALNLDMSTEEGRTALDKVREQIRKVGGDDAKAEIVPIFFADGKEGVQQSALFAVANEKGETRYIDAAGKDFDDLEDFQDNNDLFYTPGGTGRLIVPENLQMTPGADGKFALDVVQARNVSTAEEVVLPLASLGSNLLGTVLLFTPAAPVGAGLIAAGSATGIGYTVYDQVRHLRHGGEWGDERSVANIAGFASNVLAGAGSVFRVAAMMRGLNMSMGRAFLASIGITRPTGTIANTSSFNQFNRISNALGGGAMATGMVPTYISAKDLVKHGEDMSLVEYIDTWFGIATGVPGFGLAASGPSSHPMEQTAAAQHQPLNPNKIVSLSLLAGMVYGMLGGPGTLISTGSNIRSAVSKLAYKLHNNFMKRVYEMAARGQTDAALRLMEAIDKHAPWTGARQLDAAEAMDRRAEVEGIGKAGEDYRSAVDAMDPGMQDLMPDIAIHKLPVPESIFSGGLQNAPDVAAAVKQMGDEEGSEYFGKDPDTVLEMVTTKLDRSEQAYRKLYRLLREALPSKDKDRPDRVDPKAAEGKVESSMSVDTKLGRAFKLLALGLPVSAVAGFLFKPMPKEGSGSALGAYIADPIGFVPSSIVNYLYVRSNNAVSDFKAKHSYPRTQEQDKQLENLEKRKKLFSILNDLMSVPSAARNLLISSGFLATGNVYLASLTFWQALSSIGWLPAQYAPINPRVKSFLHYNAIASGIAIPLQILLATFLSEEGNKEEPSLAEIIGIDELADQIIEFAEGAGYDSSHYSNEQPAHILERGLAALPPSTLQGYRSESDWRAIVDAFLLEHLPLETPRRNNARA